MQPLSEMHQTAELQYLVKLARSAAGAHGLPQHLLCAVCERESDWNPWAMRYEPGFRWIPEGITNATERAGRMTSYGLGQVMGQVAREFGFRGKFLTELCDPVVGLEYCCKKLKLEYDKAKGDLIRCLLGYNGGGNKDYPKLVLDLAAKYKTL